MKKLLTLICLSATCLAMQAQAAEDPKASGKPATAQQNRMTNCNKQAEGKKGDERKAFMKSCLSGASAAAAPATQQDKMKSCNAAQEAKTLKGDERRAFMKKCLSGAPAA